MASWVQHYEPEEEDVKDIEEILSKMAGAAVKLTWVKEDE